VQLLCINDVCSRYSRDFRMRTISYLNSSSVVGYFEQEKLNFGKCEALVCVLPVRKLHRRINVASRCLRQPVVVRAMCPVRTGLIA
jgi:hypothetical protein